MSAQNPNATCPSHPRDPLGLWDVLGTPTSHQRHHSPTVGLWDVFGMPMSHQLHHIPTVLPIPKSPWDFGMSLEFPCLTRYNIVSLSFPSQSPLETVGCPRDSCVPPATSHSHCSSNPRVPRGLWDVLGTPMSNYIDTSQSHCPSISKSQGECGIEKC